MIHAIKQDIPDPKLCEVKTLAAQSFCAWSRLLRAILRRQIAWAKLLGALLWYGHQLRGLNREAARLLAEEKEERKRRTISPEAANV